MNGSNKTFYVDGLIVRFDSTDLKNIVLTALNQSKNEIGGIITGCYRNEQRDAIIHTFHMPASDSVRKPFCFIRGKIGITKLLKKLWYNDEYYMGEWHLHPYASPTASATDKHQLLEIAHKTEFKCPEPILIIVGSNKILYNINVYVVINGELKQMTEIKEKQN